MRKLIKTLIVLGVLLGTNSLLAQPDIWYKNWKNKSNNDSVRLSALDLLTFDLAYSNPDSALKLAEVEKTEAKTYALPRFYAQGFYNAAVACREKGNTVDAITNIRRAIEEFAAIGNEAKMANAYNILGTIFELQGNLERCTEAYLKSVKIKEKLDDKRGMANTYNNLGNSFYKAAKLDLAISYYQKSIELRKITKDDYGLAKGLNNLGSVYIDKKEYAKALSLFRTSIDLRIRSGNEKSIVKVMTNMGEVYLKMNILDSSLYYFTKNLDLARKQASIDDEASALVDMGRILTKLNKLTEAEKHLQEALNKISGKGLMNIEQNCYSCMFELYRAMKKYDKALSYHILYTQQKDSLFSLEKNGSMIQQQMRYEFEKKEAETKEIQARKDGEVTAQLNGQKKVIAISISAGIAVLILLIFAAFAYRRSKLANVQIEKQNVVITNQKHLVEEKQKEILDSINYAKRIQYTLLAHNEFLKENLVEHFTYFNPKDIVSGDFYWATKQKNLFYLAVCDSTGHGVPGAFVSLLNIGFLTEAINEKGIEKPNEVFNFVRQKLSSSISKDGQKDGFDGILLCINQSTNQITYAAANNNPVLIRNKNLIELDADRMPVGIGERKEDFKLYSIDAKPGDTLYLYTDGYADQFGGPRGKKFMYKRLNDTLKQIAELSMQQQHDQLSQTFTNWKGDLEQVDDVCIIGIKI